MNNRYGLLGKTLSHSFSPKLHSKILEYMHIEGSYELFETDEERLPLILKELHALPLKGLNVTIPYKIEMLRYVDDVSSQAGKIGSINTIAFTKNGTKGYNTDYDGFKRMLNYFQIPIQNNKVVLLGAGGASKAIIECLKDEDAADITLISRNPEKARVTFPSLNILPYEAVKTLKKDLIVNCTPIGMHPHTDASPISHEDLDGASCLVDIIYNPKKTRLMQMAEDCCIKNINGLYMLIGQAIKSQEIWNDRIIPEDIVTKIYEEMHL
ncbi:MAG: shikimate dehydrogenase [Peptostreptococcales bacterium]